MKQFIYITISVLLLAGCKPGIPKDIIQPEEMAEVLRDIHVTDAYIGTVTFIDSMKIKAASYYKGIYKKHGIDSALYVKSLAYYQNDPKALDKVYAMVLADLNASKAAIIKTDSLNSLRLANEVKQKMRKDSVRVADSIYWKTVLLKDTVKRNVNIIQPRLIFKDLR